MKPLLLMLGLAAGIAAQAQTKLKNDPGYSPNNYKHANKATEARRWEETQNLTVTVPTYATAQLPRDVGNYKRPGGRPHRETGIVRLRAGEIDQETNPSVSPRNYKNQYRTLPPSRGLAEKPTGKQSSDSEGE